MLTVLASGPLATVQDEGRRGWASIGVTTSGAADRSAAALANRLVGNESAAAVVEATAGGLRVRAERTVLVALTGAPAPVRVDGRAAPFDAPLTLAAGQVLELGMPPVGLRTYLAVRGGVDVPVVLGSRSTDTLSGLGPAPLQPGDRLPVGDARRRGAVRRRGAGAPAVVPTDPACAARPAARLARPRRMDRAHHAGLGRHRRQRPGRAAAGAARGWSGAGRTSCPARGWFPGRSRCPRTARRCSSSPTTR